MTCRQCDRSEFYDIEGTLQQVTVNAEGLCAICVEVNEEIAADDDETLRKAETIRARRAAKQ